MNLYDPTKLLYRYNFTTIKPDLDPEKENCDINDGVACQLPFETTAMALTRTSLHKCID